MNKIPNELKDDEVYMELVEISKKYDLSNFREGFAFFQEVLQEQVPDFPVKKVIKVYRSLFDKKGIPIFERIEKLPFPEQSDYFIYFFNETMQIGRQLLGIMARIKEQKDKASELTRLIKVVFGGKNADILIWYWREWELQFFSFVDPVFSKLGLKLARPDNRPKRERKIDSLKTHLAKDPKYKMFTGFLVQLNTGLRNAIAHLDYYIDDEQQLVTYYTRFKDNVTKNQIPLFDIIRMLVILLYAKLFMLVYISDKHQKKPSSD